MWDKFVLYQGFYFHDLTLTRSGFYKQLILFIN